MLLNKRDKVGFCVRRGLAISVLSIVAACGPREAVSIEEPFDPFEAENRRVHEFNKAIDRGLVRPAGKGYTEFVPDDVETLVSRFAYNLSMPSSIVNNILKGNMKGATEDF